MLCHYFSKRKLTLTQFTIPGTKQEYFILNFIYLPRIKWLYGNRIWRSTIFFSVPICAITASGVPGGILVSMNRFSTLCGWLVQRQGWRMKGEYDRVSRRDRLGLTPDLTTRDLWRSRRWARERGNFVYSSLWDFKSSFTCRKILRHGTFPLYFPSERKVRCGFLLPLKIHRLGRVLNPQTLGPVTSILTTTPPRRRGPTSLVPNQVWCLRKRVKLLLCTLSFIQSFSCSSQLEHRAPFGVSVITHTIRDTVGLLWTSVSRL
jgi:hypothetical protein